MRSDLNELRRSVKTAQRLAKKYYPSGITEPDENRLKTLINQAENYNNLDSFLSYCDKIDESDLVNA